MNTPYKIRHSRRARRISLSITSEKGLELVLPMCATVEEGLHFLNSKRAWVEKQLSHLATQTVDEKEFPTEVHLASLKTAWPIRYHHVTYSKKINLHTINNRLVFSGPIKKFETCLPTFNQWLRNLAQNNLPLWLSQISEEIQLSYNRLSIRSQKTLWGSCNRQKDISLNDRLLFLPYELVRYVLLHELCHTVYFGHGKRFWQLVSRFDPNYKSNESGLRDVSRHIPSCFR